jgi:lipid-A-disaccharide synthase
MPRLLILAGEASGDLHGEALARSLKALRPDIELEGIGGAKMGAAGVRLLSGIEKLDIIGIPTWSELRRALSVFKKLSRHIESTTVDAVILIDNPGLNLRLARVAKRAGHRVIYYIAPQIWAWNERRIKRMRRYVDRLLAILPFEEAYFRKAGVDCTFVGHPIMDKLHPPFNAAGSRADLGLDKGATLVALLPGSRKSEIERLLPAMMEAARRLADTGMRAGKPRHFVLAHAPSLPIALIERFTKPLGLPLTIVTDRTYDVIAASDAVIVASGTATLQTVLVGRPMTIVYRASALTYAISKRVIRVPFIGLANLIAGRAIAREILQDAVTGEALAAATEALLEDDGARERAEATAVELRAKLGSGGASRRAAEEILAMIGAAPQA